MTGGQKLYRVLWLAQREVGLYRPSQQNDDPWADLPPVEKRAFEIAAIVLDLYVDDGTKKAASACICNLDGEELANRIRKEISLEPKLGP